MPNFIPYEVPAGKRQDGFKPNSNHIPVSTLSEQEAKDYADVLRDAFIEHCKQKKANAAM